MRISFQRLLIITIVAMLALLEPVLPVQAGGLNSPRQALTNLTIEPLKPVVTGDHPTVTVHLTAEFGKPIPKQPIILLVDGKRKAEGVTDSRGIAVMTLKFKFPAGRYQLTAIYPGVLSIGVPSAVAKTNMRVESAKVAIYTVPPTPGVVFKLDGQTYTSDKEGVVNLEVDLGGTYPLEVLPIDHSNLASNIRMEFSRWNDNVFTPTREVHFPREDRLEAGFTVNYQVNQEFRDLSGELVDPARISSIVIRGVGTTFTFDKAGPIWLPANRLTRRIGDRLESEEILYYFRDVNIDGANVVNKGEQRFRIQPDDVWPVQVLLYSARFSARDAMFHFPIGKGIELTYPDGHKQEFFFDSANAELVIPALARGSYSARIIGAGGSAPPTPVHLSRDQGVELLMLSYLDIAVIVGIPLLIALAFFFIGRPHWFRVLRHPSKIRELVYEQREHSEHGPALR
ncbi:MAG: Ig-like domain repeat protein [Chloroflexi bacterium]|nr:MAG: Ig-like domain repeat protein [Chloroflexota bacterium]